MGSLQRRGLARVVRATDVVPPRLIPWSSTLQRVLLAKLRKMEHSAGQGHGESTV